MNSVVSASPMAVVLLIAASVAGGQQPLQPSPEQNQLAVFAGSWNYQIRGPISGSGTLTMGSVWGGQFYRGTETYRPADGNPVEIVGVLGYRPSRKEYSWYRYWSNGRSDWARGWVKGDTWYWVFEEVVLDGEPTRWHLTTKFLRPDHYTFTWQRSVEGGPWEVRGEGTATKSR